MNISQISFKNINGKYDTILKKQNFVTYLNKLQEFINQLKNSSNNKDVTFFVNMMLEIDNILNNSINYEDSTSKHAGYESDEEFEQMCNNLINLISEITRITTNMPKKLDNRIMQKYKETTKKEL